MVERDFHGFIGANAVGTPGHHSDLVVEPLDGAAGDLSLGPKPVQRWLFLRNTQRERIGSRAAEHQLDEPARLSQAMVASPQSPPPFHLASSL